DCARRTRKGPDEHARCFRERPAPPLRHLRGGSGGDRL
ncbi:MAG: hypothetical protein AVDCRST_MAG02-1483, partial [uncultured Rubrobacteraceae bacterium]